MLSLNEINKKDFMMKKRFIILAVLFSYNALSVQEIPDTSINEIAISAVVKGQKVVLYNPHRCDNLGLLLCNFFRAHEKGHIYLAHGMKSFHPEHEAFDADCWAARKAPLQEVKAAYNYFMRVADKEKWSHASGKQRAQRLAQCAQYRAGWRVKKG